MNQIKTKVSMLITAIEYAVLSFRKQNFDRALRTTTQIITNTSGLLAMMEEEKYWLRKEELAWDEEELLYALQNVLAAQENRDYILLADFLELRLLPFFTGVQQNLLQLPLAIGETFKATYEANLAALQDRDPVLADKLKSAGIPDGTDESLMLEATSSGDYTLLAATNQGNFYYHSNRNPKIEGRQLAESWHTKEKKEYAVFGLGLGYAAAGLYEKDEYIRIHIYEPDFRIIQLAMCINDFTEALSKGKMTFELDEDYSKILSYITANHIDTEVVLHYPSVRNITNKEIREAFEDYFLQYSSIKNQLPLLEGNFYENRKHNHKSLSALKPHLEGRDLYIIAAGPSLDKNFMQLKNIKDGIILATGTVFKKLIRAGIKPDYVIVTDANERVYKQVKDYEHMNVPMIYLSTAYYGFADKYQGEKYILFQNGFLLAEEHAKGLGEKLVETGGSVSTTALSLGVVSGCKRIIFLGLDLAYTDGFVHAADTSRRNLTESDNLRMVTDICGKPVKTSKSMDLYRRWMEGYLSEHREIEVVDATEGGVQVQGMKLEKLEKIIKL